jgi:glucose/mannose-6-phosphate isomerase
MMQEAIEAFNSQFSYEPMIENEKQLKKTSQYVLVGMGGSHLASDLALLADPSLPLLVHRDYGLPAIEKKELRKSLIIASSYSGNTEEVITAYKEARRHRYPLAVIAVGGKLIKMAKKDCVPYVQMPDTGIQPRSALGYSLRALFKIMGDNKALKSSNQLVTTLKPKQLESKGKALAQKMKNHVPVIYCSNANQSIAYNWKIKFNETGKIPAFYNVVPELNHNEMTGYDVKPKSKHLSQNFHFVLLKDNGDHKRVQKRMTVLEKLYRARKLPVTVLELSGKNIYNKIFTSLVIADWTAVHTAGLYGLESEQVPMVEEFKKMI